MARACSLRLAQNLGPEKSSRRLEPAPWVKCIVREIRAWAGMWPLRAQSLGQRERQPNFDFLPPSSLVERWWSVLNARGNGNPE